MGTGCGFAQQLSRKALVHYLVVPEPLAPDWVREINAGLDEAAAELKTTIIVFPSLHTPDEIGETVHVLTSDSRWTAVPTRQTAPLTRG
jgi:hypothetical protein